MVFNRLWSRARQDAARRPSFRPGLEALEDRSLPSAAGLGAALPHRGITVMSRNLYVGTELEPVVGAAASGNPTAVVQAVSKAWADVGATDFPERAGALADEIKATKPQLIAL